MNVMEDSYRKKMNLGQDGNALVELIIVNAVLFVVLKFVYVIYLLGSMAPTAFTTGVFNWLALPADLEKLSTRPWTILTYMFADQQLFRFVANMFWLWGFGYMLQDLTGNKKLVPIYIYGGLAGAFIFVLSYYLFPKLQSQIPLAILSGANPAVMAVAIATTTVAPDYRIFPMINGGIPMWVLTVIYSLISFSSFSYTDSGAYMANLGAAAMGFFFIYQMRRGRDFSLWMNRFFQWCSDLFNPNAGRKKSPKDEFYYKVSGTQPYKKIPNITQKRIDDILDKINQQGYRFLTDEEKDILKRAAEEEEL